MTASWRQHLKKIWLKWAMLQRGSVWGIELVYHWLMFCISTKLEATFQDLWTLVASVLLVPLKVEHFSLHFYCFQFVDNITKDTVKQRSNQQDAMPSRTAQKKTDFLCIGAYLLLAFLFVLSVSDILTILDMLFGCKKLDFFILFLTQSPPLTFGGGKNLILYTKTIRTGGQVPETFDKDSRNSHCLF